MPISDLASWLGKSVVFNGLDEAELRRLAGIAREVSLAPGDVLFEQGEESDGLYIVITGIVRIYLTAGDGREATISLLEDGEMIGEIALLDGLPRSAGAAALTATKLIFIPHRPFCDLLDSSPQLSRQVMLMLCERLRAANKQVDRAIFHDLRYRLLVLLREIAVIHGRVDKDVAVVDLDVTQGMLAQMLGASREAVNKQLRALAKEGGVVMEGHQIRVMKQPHIAADPR
ncbi:MAG TPA: Crp/Fnr family transcriptional regulator [Bauldia sp.]|nr:Crp/Fnr family transcriptional regulator [Bauldia sp.]